MHYNCCAPLPVFVSEACQPWSPKWILRTCSECGGNFKRDLGLFAKRQYYSECNSIRQGCRILFNIALSSFDFRMLLCAYMWCNTPCRPIAQLFAQYVYRKMVIAYPGLTWTSNCAFFSWCCLLWPSAEGLHVLYADSSAHSCYKEYQYTITSDIKQKHYTCQSISYAWWYRYTV